MSLSCIPSCRHAVMPPFLDSGVCFRDLDSSLAARSARNSVQTGVSTSRDGARPAGSRSRGVRSHAGGRSRIGAVGIESSIV